GAEHEGRRRRARGAADRRRRQDAGGAARAAPRDRAVVPQPAVRQGDVQRVAVRLRRRGSRPRPLHVGRARRLGGERAGRLRAASGPRTRRLRHRRRREGRVVKSPRDVIIRPVVSEKSYAGLESNKYTFLVHGGASKTEIKEAIQKIWNVHVLSVNTLTRKGK